MGQMGIGEFSRRSRLSLKALRIYGELGLLVPARVDPDSGYRWYDASQLETARLVASLRQLGMPLARIKAVVGLAAQAAATDVAAYWADAEIGHAARRDLAGYLVERLNGKEPAMYDITVRDMPARSLLCVLRHAHTDELFATGRDLLARVRPAAPPRPDDPVTAPFVIFHGEVSEDSDGPIEWCWPVPTDQAEEIAGRFPDLALRTEPAHQEVFIHVGQLWPSDAARITPVIESLFAWTMREHRQPSGGVRQLLIFNPDSGGKGPDGEYAVVLR